MVAVENMQHVYAVARSRDRHQTAQNPRADSRFIVQGAPSADKPCGIGQPIKRAVGSRPNAALPN
jgi:hypothetical protein